MRRPSGAGAAAAYEHALGLARGDVVAVALDNGAVRHRLARFIEVPAESINLEDLDGTPSIRVVLWADENGGGWTGEITTWRWNRLGPLEPT